MEPTTPNIREVSGILRRNRWLLLLCPLLGIAFGLGLATLRDPVYEASALILVGERQTNLTSAETSSSAPDGSRISTEIAILQSRQLARQVVDSLDLEVQLLRPAEVGRSAILQRQRVTGEAVPAEFRFSRLDGGRFRVENRETGATVGTYAPGEPIELEGAEVTLAAGAHAHEEIVLAVRSTATAVSEVVTGLEVEQPGEEANVIRVSYRGSDPEAVRDVPNVLTARYVALRDAVQKSEARNTAAFIREQMDTIARQLAMSEESLRGFRESSRVIDPQAEATSQVTQLAQLEAERSALEAERSSLAQIYAEVRRTDVGDRPGVPSPYRRLVGYPTLIRNEAASELLRNLAEVENRRATLAERRRPEDPDFQALNARVEAIERELQAIIGTYLQGLSNQVASIDATLARYRSELGTMPAKEIQFARLSRQPRVLQGMYELLQTRLKEAEIAEAVQDASVRVVDPADLPSKPVGPGAPLFAGGFAVLGLLVGIGLVFAREYADQAVHTRADVQAAIGIPVLGVIPVADSAAAARRALLPLPLVRLSAGGGNGSGSGGNQRSKGPDAPLPVLFTAADNAPTPVTDAFNRLHTNIMFAQPDAEMKALLFTSPLPGDGKTNTAANLAVTLAQSGLRVLLVDADLRRGRVHQMFGAHVKPGLSDLLSNNPVPGVLRSAEVGRGQVLRYIAAGDLPPNPVQLLSSAAMRTLIACAVQEYDRVIIDSPPLNLFPDAAVLSQHVDGVIVVARAGVTPFDALVDTADQLRQTNTRVVGAVLNGVDYERDVTYDMSYRWYQYAKSYSHVGSAG